VVGAVFGRQSICRLLVSVSMTVAFVGTVSAQSADTPLAEYTSLLQEIENQRNSLALKRALLGSQEKEIESLRAQIASVPALKESVKPMLTAMATEMRKQISSDIPFKLEERNDRMGAFSDAISKESDNTVIDQMRRALSIYSIEMGYGSTVEAYAGNHPNEDIAGQRYAACQENIESASCGLDEDQKKLVKEWSEDAEQTALEALKVQLQDGDYLRYGRLALVYMDFDGSRAYRYDANGKEWIELTGNRKLDMRRAIRMAKGESAPAVVSAPLYVK